MLKGIDISEHNGIIDFTKVKEAGINFVMIRATYGRKKEDKLFHKNVKGCIDSGLPFGLYYYSYAIDEETAKEEVDFFLKSVGKYRDYIHYPLVIDLEDSDNYKKERNALNKENITKIGLIALNKIKESGYIPMVYANYDWFKNYIDEEKIKDFPKWIAIWNKNANIDKTKYSIWQYTNSGIIEGIGTKVDLNESFFDYQKYTNYLNNIVKINKIKLLTGLQDITMQYISSYKEGQQLLNKIFTRLHDKKIKKKELDDFNIALKICKEFNLNDDEYKFLDYYVYNTDLFQKLYNSICEVE